MASSVASSPKIEPAGSDEFACARKNTSVATANISGTAAVSRPTSSRSTAVAYSMIRMPWG